MSGTPSRRELLTAAGGVSFGVLAGCATPSSSSGSRQVPSADLPEGQLTENGWEMIAEQEEHVFDEEYLAGTISVSANQHTVIYEDKQLRNTVQERTLGNLDTALKTFFATRVDINPDLNSLPLGIGVSEVVDNARDNAKTSFEKQLKNAGLTNISETGTSELQVDTGETAELIRYSASYQYNSIPVAVPEADDIVISSGQLLVSGLLAIWPHKESVLIAGGAFPSQDFEESAGTNVTDAIRVTVSIDLGLRPLQYRQEILGLIQATS